MLWPHPHLTLPCGRSPCCRVRSSARCGRQCRESLSPWYTSPLGSHSWHRRRRWNPPGPFQSIQAERSGCGAGGLRSHPDDLHRRVSAGTLALPPVPPASRSHGRIWMPAQNPPHRKPERRSPPWTHEELPRVHGSGCNRKDLHRAHMSSQSLSSLQRLLPHQPHACRFPLPARTLARG